MYDLNIFLAMIMFFVDDGMSVIYTWAVIGAGSLSDRILYQLQSTQIIAQQYPGKEVIHLPQPCLFTVFYFFNLGPSLGPNIIDSLSTLFHNERHSFEMVTTFLKTIPPENCPESQFGTPNHYH